MTDRRHRDPGRKKAPIPRDMPDQQAGGGDEGRGAGASTAGVSDADESGTARRGGDRFAEERPEPDEPPG
ncbi:hypothetical protein ABZ845_09405 [Streptomyces sp. NPDC047022]|uniref:hypothetical protein n=1 Tax=Streptomyces sp. NPDC047022 TaxID=3155737 RepID=UPI0033FF291B